MNDLSEPMVIGRRDPMSQPMIYKNTLGTLEGAVWIQFVILLSIRSSAIDKVNRKNYLLFLCEKNRWFEALKIKN